jgi:hypothetical protein
MGALDLVIVLFHVLADLILVNDAAVDQRAVPLLVPEDLVLVKDTNHGQQRAVPPHVLIELILVGGTIRQHVAPPHVRMFVGENIQGMENTRSPSFCILKAGWLVKGRTTVPSLPKILTRVGI